MKVKHHAWSIFLLFNNAIYMVIDKNGEIKIAMTFQYTVVHVRVQTYVIQMFQRNWMHAHLTGLSV